MKRYTAWPWQPELNGERFLADQYQRVSLSLHQMQRQRPGAFLFTAAYRQQGTTTAVLAVARQLRQFADSRPLLVELNRQNPCLATRLNLSSTSGISAFMAGAELEDCVADASGVAILTAGDGLPEEIRVSEVARQILDKRGDFGPVFFDVPALLESTDALAVGSVVPQTVVVVRYKQTSEESLSRIRKECANNGMEIVGSILTMREQVIPRWIERWMER
jgi:Mrp family chromosome partitioning ATPase